MAKAGVRRRCVGCLARARGASRSEVAFLLGQHHEREMMGLQEVELCTTHRRSMTSHAIAEVRRVA